MLHDKIISLGIISKLFNFYALLTSRSVSYSNENVMKMIFLFMYPNNVSEVFEDFGIP